MNSRYQLCEEAERKIRNSRLKCESNDLVRWAKESGLSYGLFMNALYQRNIDVILANKSKPQRKLQRDPDDKIFCPKRREAKIASLPYYISVVDRATGKEAMSFNTLVAAAEHFGISYATCCNMVELPDIKRKNKAEEIRQKYLIRKMPKEKGVMFNGKLDEECD